MQYKALTTCMYLHSFVHALTRLYNCEATYKELPNIAYPALLRILFVISSHSNYSECAMEGESLHVQAIKYAQSHFPNFGCVVHSTCEVKEYKKSLSRYTESCEGRHV